MFGANKNNPLSETLLSADMTSLGSFSRQYYLDVDTFPVRFVDNEALDFAVYPVRKLPVHLLTPLSLFQSKPAEVLDGNHGVVLLGLFNNSFGSVVCNPCIDAVYLPPQFLYLLGCSLPLWKLGSQVVDAFPVVTNLIE